MFPNCWNFNTPRVRVSQSLPQSNNNSLWAALSVELNREGRERGDGVNRGNRGDISDSLDIVHVTAGQLTAGQLGRWSASGLVSKCFPQLGETPPWS